ncbi:MAG: 2-oxo acid dehydrogenase subunit E2, partial [Deltaproteobacteria bacterium]|nr:2-oxo acid dehydrogenase subunit E2 [Deltaproteobacteria bacterium]
MATTVRMPSLGESVLEGVVGKWFVREGDFVEREQVLAEVLTDKTDTEIPAPVSGVVVKLLVPEGAPVRVGGELLIIDEEARPSVTVAPQPKEGRGDAPSASPSNAPTPSLQEQAPPRAQADGEGRRPLGTPWERRKARELGVDVATIRGASPKEPQITEKGREGPPTPSSGIGFEASHLSPLPSMRILQGQGAFRVPPYTAAPGDKVIPFDRRRRVIADHMVYSKLVSPHVVTFAECDLYKTHLLREQHKEALAKEGIRLTFLAFVAAAVARALREHPLLNARVLDDAYVLLSEINLGIAVETPKGLVVPVVRRADELNVRGLARAIDAIVEKARNDALEPSDLVNKTFTISNPGRKGNLVGGAIINQPNVGILRMGEIKKRPVVIEANGEDFIAIHPVMYMALSYD